MVANVLGQARGLLSGDERTLGLVLVGGLLISTFTATDTLREALLAGTTNPAFALALVCLVAAIAWLSLARRSFVWFSTAGLTWADFGGTSRHVTIGRRLHGVWLVRVCLVGYLTAALAALHRMQGAVLFPGITLLGTTAVLALACARRPSERVPARLDWLAPLSLAAGAFLLVTELTPALLYGLSVPAVVAAVGLLSCSPARPEIATGASRTDLVRGWHARLVRRVSMAFLDPMMALPGAEPVTGTRLLAGRHVLVRLALLGVIARRRYLIPAGLFAFFVVLAHRAMPGLPPVWFVALGGYLALVPFGAGLGELWRHPSRLRWIDAGELRIRLGFGAVLGLFALLWGGLVVLVGGFPLVPWQALLVLPLVAASVVRTVTRPMPRYDDLMPVEMGIGGLIPVRLVAQFVRGPDLGLLGVLMLATPQPVAVAVVVTAALVILCVVR